MSDWGFRQFFKAGVGIGFGLGVGKTLDAIVSALAADTITKRMEKAAERIKKMKETLFDDQEDFDDDEE